MLLTSAILFWFFSLDVDTASLAFLQVLRYCSRSFLIRHFEITPHIYWFFKTRTVRVLVWFISKISMLRFLNAWPYQMRRSIFSRSHLKEHVHLRVLVSLLVIGVKWISYFFAEMLSKTEQPVVLQKIKHIMVMISSWWLRLFMRYLLFQISTGLSRRSTFKIFILLNILSSRLKVAEYCLSYILKALCSACATLGVWFTWQGRSIILAWVVAQDRSYAWLKKMVSCLSFLCRTLICKIFICVHHSFFSQ